MAASNDKTLNYKNQLATLKGQAQYTQRVGRIPSAFIGMAGRSGGLLDYSAARGIQNTPAASLQNILSREGVNPWAMALNQNYSALRRRIADTTGGSASNMRGNFQPASVLHSNMGGMGAYGTGQHVII